MHCKEDDTVANPARPEIISSEMSYSATLQ